VSTAPAGPVRVTLVPAPACHFCEDAEQALADLARVFAFDLELVPVDSARGARLVAEHRPALSPLVLVDGAYFSAGRLPRKKLTRLLTARGAALAPAGRDG
jgi:alkyl hydroperoxide reductase subunit AhpF